MQDRGKLSIFIDGNSLFHAAKAVNLHIDYAKLLSFLADEDMLVRASFYTGLMVDTDCGNQKQQSFLYFMRRNGYRVVTRELRRSPDGAVRGGLEVEIATDMLTLAPHCDTVLLVAGSEALVYPLEHVSRMGRRVEVAMFRGALSPRLLEVCDTFHDLELVVDRVAKEPGAYQARPARVRVGDDEDYESDPDY